MSAQTESLYEEINEVNTQLITAKSAGDVTKVIHLEERLNNLQSQLKSAVQLTESKRILLG